MCTRSKYIFTPRCKLYIYEGVDRGEGLSPLPPPYLPLPPPRLPPPFWSGARFARAKNPLSPLPPFLPPLSLLPPLFSLLPPPLLPPPLLPPPLLPPPRPLISPSLLPCPPPHICIVNLHSMCKSVQVNGAISPTPKYFTLYHILHSCLVTSISEIGSPKYRTLYE